MRTATRLLLVGVDPGDLQATTLLLTGVYSQKADPETQRNAVPALREGLADKDEGVRKAPAEALRKVQPR